jgi:hypothetical protein
MQLMVEGDKFVSCITSSVENIGCGLLTWEK